jgi:hypothetical protein
MGVFERVPLVELAKGGEGMYDLRVTRENNRLNLDGKVVAYRLTPMGRVILFDAYDVYSALVLGYEILIEERG